MGPWWSIDGGRAGEYGAVMALPTERIVTKITFPVPDVGAA